MVEFFASRTVFVTLGNLTIYWYGLLYVVAFWGAWLLLPTLGKMRRILLSRDQWTSIVAWGALGVLLGGRIGYALFYEPLFFFSHPLELFQIWHGGMSSHGGFLGAALFVWLATRSLRVDVFSVADCIAPMAALGLGIGRVGNIINQEFGMYAWYEATGDFLIATLCYLVLRREKRSAVVFALFLLLYGIQRFFLEYVRPQEWASTFGLSRGQLLTIPLLIAAVILLKHAYKRGVQKAV